MRKVYLDTTHAGMCMSVFVKDAEVILAGTPVNAIPENIKMMNIKGLQMTMIFILYLKIIFQELIFIQFQW